MSTVDLLPMPPGTPFSPSAVTTADILSGSLVIPMSTTAGLPAAPNFATVTMGVFVELVYYVEKAAAEITCPATGGRGFYSGFPARAWPAGAGVIRAFGEEDFRRLRENIMRLNAGLDNAGGDVLYRHAVYGGL